MLASHSRLEFGDRVGCKLHSFNVDQISSALVGAAINNTGWESALECTVAETRSHGVLFLPLVGDIPLLAETPSVHRSTELYLQGGWHEQDQRRLGMPRLMSRGVMTDDDCMPADARKRSAYYQDFIAKAGLSDFAGVRVGRGDSVWILSIQRTRMQGPFSRSELRSLAALSTRLDGVAEISKALGLAQGSAALDAFQFSGRAAVLLNRAGDVVRVNAKAEQMIGEDIRISRGQITCRRAATTSALRDSIKRLLWSRSTAAMPPINFPSVSGGQIVLYPIRLHGLTDSPLASYHAILVIVDTHEKRATAASALRHVFEMTAAESRLAAALLDGQSLSSYSSAVGISKDTARHQLRAVFAKTGTSRQAELALVLAKLLPE